MPEIHVDMVYALPERQYMRSVTVEEGAAVEQAIVASGLLTLRTDIDLQVNKVGIFSRSARLTDEVTEGDRVEIYRPLIVDPK
ncbi:RnfH family protein [BEV proteobacterium]|nr:RnfH family protein [Candidatus Symbiopectobacterium sp. Chty_BC]